MKIAEVSKRYDLTTDTLRYYERAGLLRHVPRNASGIREYDESACRTIEFVKCMRDAGVSIKALCEYMELLEQGDGTVLRRKELLEEQRVLIEQRVNELQQALNSLDYKIENYEDSVVPHESTLHASS